MNKLNHNQQLQIIEGLCLLFEEGDTDDIMRANEFIGDIYKISHLNGNCENEHLDWYEDAILLAKSLEANGITKIEGIQ